MTVWWLSTFAFLPSSFLPGDSPLPPWITRRHFEVQIDLQLGVESAYRFHRCTYPSIFVDILMPSKIVSIDFFLPMREIMESMLFPKSYVDSLVYLLLWHDRIEHVALPWYIYNIYIYIYLRAELAFALLPNMRERFMNSDIFGFHVSICHQEPLLRAPRCSLQGPQCTRPASCNR